MKNSSKVYTTGEVAELCGVTHRTVVNWIQRGEIESYKLPGRRGDNRITESSVIRFMQVNGLPIPDDLTTDPKSEPQRAGIDVLVVDDEVPMAKAISRLFKSKGYRTACAHDGFEAGTLFAQHSPRLVTLDLQMPRMDGLSVLPRIKAKGTKVIVVSAAESSLLEQAKTLGADMIVSKPFDNDELLRIASDFL